MYIVVVGVDHTTAPISLRERLACSPHQISYVLETAQRVVQESGRQQDRDTEGDGSRSRRPASGRRVIGHHQKNRAY